MKTETKYALRSEEGRFYVGETYYRIKEMDYPEWSDDVDEAYMYDTPDDLIRKKTLWSHLYSGDVVKLTVTQTINVGEVVG